MLTSSTHRIVLLGLSVALVVISLAFGACEKKAGASKAERAQAKAVKEQELLDLPYPKSNGLQPKNMDISYDGAGDRTLMTLRLDGLRATGPTARGVQVVQVHLTSSYRGRTRRSDDPEGTLDGRALVTTSTPGLLAYSGVPGALGVEGEKRPLKPASKKNSYASLKVGPSWEESVTFKVATADLVAAVNAQRMTLTLGTLELEVPAEAAADVREFVARLNPRPAP